MMAPITWIGNKGEEGVGLGRINYKFKFVSESEVKNETSKWACRRRLFRWSDPKFRRQIWAGDKDFEAITTRMTFEAMEANEISGGESVGCEAKKAKGWTLTWWDQPRKRSPEKQPLREKENQEIIMGSRWRDYQEKGMVIPSNAAERTIKYELNSVNMVF